MATVTAFEAKTRFGQLLDRVTHGEEIVITRHDKPVARIIPEGRTSLVEIQQAVKDLRELRSSMAKRRGFKLLTDKEIRNAIGKGRP
jgi:prevent-host-death family protein